MEELGILENGRLTAKAGDTALFGLAADRASAATTARINVGHSGARLKTATGLKLRADHGVAIDAVWDDSDCPVADSLGFYRVQTLVNSKEEYLRRPDRARCFSDETIAALKDAAIHAPTVQIMAADGLSPRAIEANLGEMYALVTRECARLGYDVGTPIFVKYGRVATMDKISTALGARVTLLFVGERPGLGTDESMSCYMGYECSALKPESQRNVVSNIHRRGLPVTDAAGQVVSLVGEMLAHCASGVDLNRLLRGAVFGAANAAGGLDSTHP
jgi:ethanolamine ammonia-lyase small subunit